MSNNNYVSLFNNVFNENIILQNTIKNIEESDSTYNQNVNYKIELISTFESVRLILFFIYYLSVIITIYLVIPSFIRSKRYMYSSIICLLFIFLPYILTLCQNLCYYLIRYIWTFVIGISN